MSQPERSGSIAGAFPGGRTGIDPRGPRFSAGITAVLLLVDIFLGVLGLSGDGSRIAAVVLLAAIAVLFAWGAFAGVQKHPYGVLYRKLVRPRLAPPSELEDPVPPTFAQLVGLIITGIGAIVALLGVAWAAPLFAALAFVAAFLNSVFGYCLGCQMYLLGVRLGVFGRSSRPTAA